MKKPQRNANYLKFVRAQSCLLCPEEELIHAHHWNRSGTGTKCSDLDTVPLCWRCHRNFHDGRFKFPSGDYSRTQLLDIFKSSSQALNQTFFRETSEDIF